MCFIHHYSTKDCITKWNICAWCETNIYKVNYIQIYRSIFWICKKLVMIIWSATSYQKFDIDKTLFINFDRVSAPGIDVVNSESTSPRPAPLELFVTWAKIRWTQKHVQWSAAWFAVSRHNPGIFPTWIHEVLMMQDDKTEFQSMNYLRVYFVFNPLACEKSEQTESGEMFNV